ncbi:MAG: tRNA (guanosine(37)-N1)-methyltransferase TrmD [Synergistales bacterium]|nr:tRNA (guanosine(37)-N1)-methyltransferase TrmD [Synergistales bacterium]
MKVTIITAFPDFMDSFISTSILGRAVKEGLIDISILDLRSYSQGNYRQIDDYAFGGGGMVLMAEPLQKALHHIFSTHGRGKVIFPSPQGGVMTQQTVETLSTAQHLIFICGHYEGIDERFCDQYVDLEISIGDYVLTGGEIPCMAIIDAVSRLLPGVVGKEQAVIEDSFYRGMLDHPHYTRPSSWKGIEVPEVLLSGDKKAIGKWRREQAVQRTLARRPDLLSRANIMPYLDKSAYVALVHHPVLDRKGESSTAAVTGLDIHDISRTCRTYGIKRFFIITPIKSQRDMAREIMHHWTEGYGATFNPLRGEALKLAKIIPSIEKTIAWVEEKEKVKPYVIATTAKFRSGSTHWMELKKSLLTLNKPVLFLFGTSWGLDEDVFSISDSTMQPIRGGINDYNHLSVRNAVAITMDRFFGFR